jgi:hypothetical protein
MLWVSVNDAVHDGAARDSLLGGVALEPVRYGPARIFRFGPSDRDTGAYYLEDPTSPLSSWGFLPIRLSPPLPDNVTHVIYDVEGDLHLHNKHARQLFFDLPQQVVQLTVHVRGNVFIANDVLAPPGRVRIAASRDRFGRGGEIVVDARSGALPATVPITLDAEVGTRVLTTTEP